MKTRTIARQALKVSLLAIPVVLTACKEPAPPATPTAAATAATAAARVDVESVLARMDGVDARVQATGGLSVLEEHEPMVRAAIQFADAFARGDDAALEGMLSADARTILDDLRFGGQWYDAVGDIEQVRVVYMTADARSEGIELMAPGASPASDFGSMNDMMSAMAEHEDALMSIGVKVMEAANELNIPLDASMAENLSPERIASGNVPEELEPLIEKLREDGTMDEIEALNQKITADAGLVSDAMAPGGDDASGAVALAIQTPGEAYVLGWSVTPVGGSYVFGGAPTNAPAVARASELDGTVGAHTFAIDFSALSRSGDARPAALGVPEPEPEEEAEEEEKPKETVRRTPRGPITIPGGG